MRILTRSCLVLSLIVAPHAAWAQEDTDDAAAGSTPPTPAPLRTFVPMEARGEVGEDVPPFVVRPGYRVTVASTPGLLRDAQFLAAAPRGILFVAEPAHGTIVLLRDDDRDGVYDEAVAFLEGHSGVRAVQFVRGWLYFSTPTSVGRARDTDGDLIADDVEMILEHLEGSPQDVRSMLLTRLHLYTAIGGGDDAADPTAGERQKLWAYSLDGARKTLWASGLAAPRELHVRPGTDEIWALDVGGAGGELDRLREGGFHGHPFLDANGDARPEHAGRTDLAELRRRSVDAMWTFPLEGGVGGWTFLSPRNRHFPPDHRGDGFVALGGTAGDPSQAPRIERLLVDPWTGTPAGSLLLVRTSDDAGNALAKPLDIVELRDGTLIFGTVEPQPMLYRIAWIAADAATQDPPPPAATPENEEGD